jgi:serine/threonine-protein kinase
MGILIPLIAVLGAFVLPMYVARLRHEEKKRRYELEARSRGGGDDQDVKRITDENRLLRERVENLESIVCSVDFELNQKLAKVIDEQRSLLLPAGASPSPVPSSSGRAASAGDGSPSPAPRSRPGSSSPPPALERTATAFNARPSPPLTTSLEPGQILAQRYRIQRLLGKGGMGAVYLAEDEVLGELVALKVISSAFAADEVAMVARFRREAAAARKVSSPSVIRIHDLGEARPGLLYLSMEYFAGRTLTEIIAQRGVVPLKDVQDMLQQIGAGLEAAHQVGVIHRDLKPSNILVGERGMVKIIDFGLATTQVSDGLTATGTMLGTPHYMAPEQVRGRPVDARTDIYALGALAYHLVCGRPPFAGDNPIAIGFAHISEPIVAPRLLRKDVPSALEAAIVAALSKAPEDRPATAKAFVDRAFAAA